MAEAISNSSEQQLNNQPKLKLETDRNIINIYKYELQQKHRGTYDWRPDHRQRESDREDLGRNHQMHQKTTLPRQAATGFPETLPHDYLD